MITPWPCPGGDEFAVVFDRGRPARLLIVPPLFAEMNHARGWLVATMRALDAAGIDSFLPDLPGTNESLQAFPAQSLHGWRMAMAAAARHFRASHVLAVRGGALIFPNALPGWVIDPIAGHTLLRPMLRAAMIAAREAGMALDTAAMLETGRHEGLLLAGYDCGPALIAGLDTARPLDEGQRELRSADLGGSAPWQRAEPGYDPASVPKLAAILAAGIAA